MKARSHTLAVAALAVLPVLFFWRITLGGQALFVSDMAFYYVPLRYFGTQIVRSGHVPFWLPYVFCGVPFLANIQTAVFYPFTVLFYMMPLFDAVTITFVFHIFLAGLFMFLFGRYGLRLGVFPSFIGGTVFMFSGFFGGHSPHLNQVISCPWFPLAMLFFALATDRGKFVHIALAGLALSMQFLGGGAQNSFHSFFALSLFALLRTIQAFRNRATPRDALRPFLVLAAVASLSVLLAAVQLLPSYQLSQYSVRAGGVEYWFATAGSLDPVQFVVTLLFPHLFGNHSNSYWGLSNFQEMACYVGILPLILAAFAIHTRREHPWVLFSMVLCIAALFFALGGLNPMYVLFYRYVPGFNLFRVPSRFIFLFVFAAATLCAIGTDSVLGDADQRQRKAFGRFLASFSGLVSLFGLVLWAIVRTTPRTISWLSNWYAQKISTTQLDIDVTFAHSGTRYAEMLRQSTEIFNPWFGTSLILILLSLICFMLLLRQRPGRTFGKLSLAVLLIFDLFFLSLGMEYNSAVPRNRAIYETDWIRFLRNNVGSYRVHTSLGKYLNPNANLLHEVADADGYGGAMLPLKSYSPIGEVATLEYPRILDLLNVKYIVSGTDLDPQGYEEVRSGDPYIYENTDVLPKAFIVHQALFLEDEEMALAKLKSPDFRPGEIVILEGLAPANEPGREMEPQTSPEAVRIVQYSPTKVIIETSSDADGFLVLCDTFYPNWRCFVDGNERDIYRANLYLRSVALPRGKHIVEFKYDSVLFAVGLFISLVTLVAMSAILTFPLVRRWTRCSPEIHFPGSMGHIHPGK